MAPLLCFEDVKSLLLVGDPHIAKVLGSTVTKIELRNYLPYLDLEKLLTALRTCHRITSLIFQPTKDVYRLLKPLSPLQPHHFPPNLTKLFCEVSHSLDYFLVSHDLATLAPGLLELDLAGKMSEVLSLSDLKFPSKLMRLRLIGSSIKVEDERQIARLPRSLTFLSMRMDDLPPITGKVWPPELLTLHLKGMPELITIEHLPRSLTDLYLAPTGPASTSFKPAANSGEEFSFPWRRFFPALISIDLNGVISGSKLKLLESLVMPDAYDASEVDNFLTRGFWSCPQLDTAPTSDYALFERITLYGEILNLEEVLRALAPYLTKVIELSLAPNEIPFAAYCYLPSITIASSAVAPHLTLPEESALTYFTELTLHRPDFSVVERQKSLRRLRLREFADLDANQSALDAANWPTTLRNLASMMDFSSTALLQLPSTLTSFNGKITERSQWSALATHSVCLRTLEIWLDRNNWCRTTEALAPIASKVLESLAVNTVSECPHSYPEPYMHEFFKNPSTLPPSLVELHLGANSILHSIPLTVIPSLPRQLLRLSMKTSVAWINPRYKTDPHVASMTPSELLASLPRGLKALELQLYERTEGSRQSVSALASLPNLHSFIQRGLFTAPTEANMEEILAYLPPNLSALRYDSSDKLYDAYFAKDSRRLYTGAQPASSSSH